MGICVSLSMVQRWFLKLKRPKRDKIILNAQPRRSLLAAEIEHVSNLFQEKQAELQSAVLRVDQVIWTALVKRNWVWI